jgi:hypothetical protein
MRKLVLAATFVLAATSASFAQSGFNPGTVVSNTYDKLEERGCDPGFGFSPPGCNYGRLAPGHVAGRPYRRGAATSNRRAGSVD